MRVILVAVVCDKPAAHKIAGFGSHSHTMFCTKCWITTEHKNTARAFEANGTHFMISVTYISVLILSGIAFQARTNAEHRRQCGEYAALKTEAARKAYTKAHAVRFTQLARLPYFDIVRQVVVDPMHNLYLGEYIFCLRRDVTSSPNSDHTGLVKTHFYHIWVQTDVLREKHELRVLHELLADVRDTVVVLVQLLIRLSSSLFHLRLESCQRTLASLPEVPSPQTNGRYLPYSMHP